jgi:hypothetical protein
MSETSDAISAHTDTADRSGAPAAKRSDVISPDGVATAGDESNDEPTDGREDGRSDEVHGDSVTEPGKVMRIGSMIKQLLEEVRTAELDEASRERLAEVYERSIVELSEALSPDLQDELRNLSLPFEHDDVPSEAELRVAKAQLVGWLEGLFHGIQASLMAQQFAAQQQLQQMRQLPGQPGQSGAGQPGPGQPPPQTGTYL